MANPKSSNKKVSKLSPDYKTPGRTKPMTPKAGYTHTRRRYGNGGKASK